MCNIPFRLLVFFIWKFCDQYSIVDSLGRNFYIHVNNLLSANKVSSVDLTSNYTFSSELFSEQIIPKYMMEYCRRGVKPKTINPSINNTTTFYNRAVAQWRSGLER